jgi:hypothetical protein
LLGELRGADVKTHRVVGYVFAAFACASACGGSPATSIPVSVGEDGGAPQAGGTLTKSDADVGGAEVGVAAGRFDAGGVDAATNAGPSTSDGQYCCVSGAYYACPSQAALAQCTGFDVADCLQSCPPTNPGCARACGQMASTAHSDPSACTHDASNDAICASFDAGSGSAGAGAGATGSGGTPPAPPPERKNACGGYFLGTACMVGGQCYGDMHCSQNECYPNDVGNPCTFGSDCGDGNHCTAGCCASSAKGSACTFGIDCKSGTCTGGVCQ